MTQEELFGTVTEKVNDGLEKEKSVTKKFIGDVYNAIIDTIYEETEKETEMSITIPKLGILKTSIKEAYTAKNPRTGEDVEVPRRRQVRMSICKALKDKVEEGTSKKAKAKKAPEKKAPAKKAVDKKPATGKKVSKTKKVIKKKK